MTTKKTPEPPRENLEKLFTELDTITEEMSSGRLDLERSMARFERGLYIAELLKKRLAEIENKIETIKVRYQAPAEEPED